MKYLPCKELTAILLPAYTACGGDAKTCPCGRKLDSANGYIPRGFSGGFGEATDIALILVVAEPGNPDSDGSQAYDMAKTDQELIADSARGVFEAVQRSEGRKDFHGSIRMILNECWPGLSLADQFRRTWITESVLCSAEVSCGPIPRSQERNCAERFLRLQLEAIPNRFVVALGGKAERRMKAASLSASFTASAPGKPECLKERARQSWVELGRRFRRYRERNG